MKKVMMAILMMAMSANVMAQEENDGQRPERKPRDRQEMIQKRTDHMVEKYGLNSEQAEQLLTLNKEYADKMRPMRGEFRRHAKKMKPAEGKLEKIQPAEGKLEKVQPVEGKPEKVKPVEAKPEEVKKDMDAYEAKLQKIMTEEQFKAYKADRQKRGDRQRGPKMRKAHQD